MRVGNYSSSAIFKLMTNNQAKNGFGVPALTYINEKRLEIRLGRSLQKERSSRPTSWGKFIEKRVYNYLDLSYKLQSSTYYTHESIPNWVGSPDMITDNKVCDIKCPFSLGVYCEKADIMIANDIEGLKKKFPENYWQLVSNSILTGKPIAELIIYCPYLEELAQILTEVKDYDGDQNEIAWINWANDDELPYLIKGNYYQNLYKMEFVIPEEDKQALYERVKKATELL